ncbi:MAG: hypothetical protein DRJ42_20705, partial [Deltaproteobacteria bacterium]
IELSAGDEVARIHFNAGRSHYDRGDYTSAAREFQTGYDHAPFSAFLFNLYLTYERLGDFSTAATHLERYLRVEPGVEGHAMLSDRLVHLRERAAQQSAETARVTEVEAAAAQADEATAAATRAEEEARRAEARRLEAQGPNLFVPATVSYGVGAAGLATFAIFGALAASENSSLTSMCGEPYGGRGTYEPKTADSLRTYSLVADIGLGVAIAGVITGTVLILIHDPDADDEDEDEDEDEEGFEVAITPMLGPGVAGISTAGSF